jgi:small subunit ribosomal protein S12
LRVLDHAPQKKGVCLKIYICTPKKPNSAKRKIAKVKLSTKFEILMYIQGEGHNLKAHSTVLVRAGKTQDLPGLKFKGIRGVSKYSFAIPNNRRKKRSKYGIRRPKDLPHNKKILIKKTHIKNLQNKKK